MKKNNYVYSEYVGEFEYTPRTATQKILYALLDKRQEEKCDPMLNPTVEDIKEVVSRVGVIKNHLITTYYTVDGILYIDCELGGVSADYMINHSRKDLAHELLVAYRGYWQETRGILPAPFVTMLTAKALQLAVPISIKGYRTLAMIQKEQIATAKKSFDTQAEKELRKARARRNYRL